MAFSFNFDVQLDAGDSCLGDHATLLASEENKTSKNTEEAGKPLERTLKEAKEHRPPLDCRPLLENSVCETLSLGTLPPLCYLNESVLEQTASERPDQEKILTQTAASHSDLIAGVYEGGLRIWECTFDLLGYLESEGVTFSGKKVLDLGCGAGLLGILALKRGAQEVHFQDYNSTVIEALTLPNVLLNIEEEEEEGEGKSSSPSPKRRATGLQTRAELARCRFFSGDWASFLTLLLSSGPPPKYDMILTSETIYNTASYPALHAVLSQLLAPVGQVYLATKAHYFGVGGGLHLFQSYVEEKNIFSVKRVKDVEQGLQRHVVLLSFKERDAIHTT
ncbi:histidine protein methyltransferase 1 homolog [Lepisosteus oculatus]|uniref:histidine protein methyltransferase 1 homolog n=1 Tax=Lepisosteus oculatus TaxID=7918 RepID=UPI00371CC432